MHARRAAATIARMEAGWKKKGAPHARRDVQVVLDHVRSVYNVGAIFRTAEAAGTTCVHLCGVAPAPVDRFGRPRAALAKVALGAERALPWRVWESAAQCVRTLAAEGFFIAAVEQDPRARDFRQSAALRRRRVAYVLGDEVRGVSEEVRALADEIVEIPLAGTKESLNVAVAAGIVLFCRESVR